MSRILVVDDKEMMRDSVATTLARRDHNVIVAPSAKAALEKIAQRSPDALITDLQMPEMSGLELLAEVRRLDEQLPVILMTAYGTVESAVAAMKQGAYDYITKPFSGDELIVAVERALEHARLVRENQILKAQRHEGAEALNGPSDAPAMTRTTMIGDGAAMTELKERLALMADSHGTVLVSGESGSGKEVAARWIHLHSPRRNAPFLAINCAALSTSLLESELFGHEKGAFTGADKLRKGRFELADGGTLMLDEISEIAPGIQAKLLRVLQERSFERVGSSVTKSVDVRVIATTNRDLPAEVARGTFRQDLFFRLNVLPLHMPSLRDRSEDVPALSKHFLQQVARREGRPVKDLQPQALSVLQQYAWPGNVRELQNICERAAVLTSGNCIEAALIEPWLNGPMLGLSEQVPARAARRDSIIEISPGLAASVTTPRLDSLRSAAPLNGHSGNGANGPAVTPHAPDAAAIVCDGQMTLEEIERRTILATLQHNRGHRQRSAAALGIGVRTLGLKLKKWKELKIVEQTV